MTWLSSIISFVIVILQQFIKNPTSVAEEKTIIHDLAVASTQADAVAGSGTWTYTPNA
jgi:hypothetical protein